MIEVDLEATDIEADLEASELAAGPGGGGGADGFGGAGGSLLDDDDELADLGLEPNDDDDGGGWDVTVEDVDGWIGAVLAAEDGDFEDEGDFVEEEEDDGRPATRRGAISG